VPIIFLLYLAPFVCLGGGLLLRLAAVVQNLRGSLVSERVPMYFHIGMPPQRVTSHEPAYGAKLKRWPGFHHGSRHPQGSPDQRSLFHNLFVGLLECFAAL
jgi:hypothetical protein